MTLTCEEFARIPEELKDCYVLEKELRIIKELAKGKSTKQAALDLRINYKYAANLVSDVTRRLHSNSYDLIYRVFLMGLLK